MFQILFEQRVHLCSNRSTLFQDLQNFFWEEDQVNERLTKIMRHSYANVEATMKQYGTDMRTAALIIGVKRVADATVRRGIFP